MTPDRTARVWATTGTTVGALASIAANVADVHASGQPVAAVAGAVFWPIALLIAAETLARKRWANRRAQVAGGIAVAAVAAVAFAISYQHMRDLLDHWGESTLTALIGPLAVDGLMVVSALALVSSDRPAPAPALAPPRPDLSTTTTTAEATTTTTRKNTTSGSLRSHIAAQLAADPAWRPDTAALAREFSVAVATVRSTLSKVRSAAT